MMRTQNKNLTIFNQQPSQIVDLSDGDSNRVLALDEKYIYKQYFSSRQLYQETVGYLLFNKLSSYGVPLVIDKGADYLVFEYIAARSGFQEKEAGALSDDEIANKIALFMAEVYWNYRFFDRGKIGLFQNFSWSDRLQQIIQFAARTDQDLTTGEQSLIRRARQRLPVLEIPWQSLTILHRDIHLDNFLLKKDTVGRDRNYIIDYEHCMEGPIELEMQNSIFWNDDWSISVQKVRDQLVKEHQIVYSIEREKALLDFYFIDQLNLATRRQDPAKKRRLIDIYAERRKEVENL